MEVLLLLSNLWQTFFVLQLLTDQLLLTLSISIFLTLLTPSTLFTFLYWIIIKPKKQMYNKGKSFIDDHPRNFNLQCYKLATIEFVLTSFMPLISFYNPWKFQELSGIFTISKGIEKDIKCVNKNIFPIMRKFRYWNATS